jgi:D-alanyl-D-alanine carboxypeptidase (penicillin-binding protein 5/6)
MRVFPLAAAWGFAAFLAVVALALPAGEARAQQTIQTSVPYAILMDSETGAVLFEKAADEAMVPASMAKLMTLEMLFNEIKEGKVSLDDEFLISENAWRRGGAPSGGSAMFAALNSKVKVSDLILGVCVQSGNDAAIAIAEALAGTENAFAARMTTRAKEIGLKGSTFANATGMPDPDQKMTARDLATLANHIIKTYPELYKNFGVKEFTWNKIRQQNRNPLLFMDVGADGLKTGNVGDSGFGVTGSAVQNDQRLIVVVNGAKTAKERAEEARKLLNWGFRAFEVKELFPAGSVVGEAKVYGGEPGSVDLVTKAPVRILVPRGNPERVTAKVVYQGPLRPPVAAGTQVGRLRIQRGDVQALDIPLYVQEDAGQGKLTKRALDAASELVIGFVRSQFAKK